MASRSAGPGLGADDEAAPRAALIDGTLDWTRARPAVNADPDAVTVVVPVYGSLDETLACLHSVLTSATSVPYHLVVIDDCSLDPAVYTSLAARSDAGRLFSLWRNPENRGFVHTANRGLLAARGDVVLLNSDTLVTDHWLDNMVAAAHSDPSIASVSPLSNNATILSYPHINKDNDVPDDLSLADLAAMISPNREHLSPVEVPVTVGFCMLLKRAAIEATGGFDEALFGTGYGEESDWCMRASALGYKHVAAIDTFVYHVGSVSFSEKSVRRQELAARALAQRHPAYWPTIGHFCAADPLKAARRLIDIRRLHRAAARFDGVFLQVLHALGGGTQVHAEHLADLLEHYNVGSLFLRPGPNGQLAIDARFVDLPNLVFDCAHDLDELRDLLEGLKVDRLHIHAVLGFSPEATAFVDGLRPAATVTLHDYLPICPQITLLDQTKTFCDLPETTHCNRCLAARRPPIPAESIQVWRRAWTRRLQRADRIIAPSAFVERMFHRIHPDLEIEVVPHHEHNDWTPVATQPPDVRAAAPVGPRLIAVLGNLNEHKGIDVVASCAAYALEHEQPLQFVVFGRRTSLDDAYYRGKLRTIGAYERADLPDLMAKEGCTIGFLPSIWPETYSFVLSEMLYLGLHPVVFDLGAPADRLRAIGTGTILDVGLGPAGINARLMDLTPDLPTDKSRIASSGGASDYLARLYGRSFDRPMRSAGSPARARAKSYAMSP